MLSELSYDREHQHSCCDMGGGPACRETGALPGGGERAPRPPTTWLHLLGGKRVRGAGAVLRELVGKGQLSALNSKASGSRKQKDN